MQESYTTAQKEAFLNEYKGSLFEFLVGLELWQKMASDRAHFSAGLTPMQLDRLQSQEDQLRRMDPELLVALPAMALEVADCLSRHLPGELLHVRLIGESTDQLKKEWCEGDLLLHWRNQAGEHWQPVSLKLCKANAYVNTKPAGIKSFLTKYFSAYFSRHPLDVRQLVQAVDFHFHHMAERLHQGHGLAYHGDWREWQEAGLSMLPGQLDPQDRALVLQFYHQMMLQLRQLLEIAYQADPQEFARALAPVIGHGRRDMWQVICFYAGEAADRFKQREICFFDHQWVEAQMQGMQFAPVRSHGASFDIALSDAILQIRLKPMNTFTVPALKVNASVRYGLSMVQA